MKNKLLYCFVVSLLLAVFVIVVPVSAQGLKSAGDKFKDVGTKAGANTYENPQDLIGVGINAALTLVGLFFLVLMIYAGYLWMTARGEEEPINKAKKIIVSTLIGFVLVASAYSITVFVGQRFEKGTKAGAGAEDDAGGDPTLMGCCRVCIEKIGGNFYDDPEYAWVSEAACNQSCSAEDEGECYKEFLNKGEDKQDVCNLEKMGKFDCDENKPEGMD